MIGLEIKREFLEGELASAKQAILPIAAAAGGMVMPALFYLLLNHGRDGAGGWGIPMATDIAFAIGVLALLGSRVPPALKVFVAAVAIADDLGAVLVIAFFYTAQISWLSLALGGLCFAALLTLNLAGVRRHRMYFILGLGLWLAFLKSGIHATIAGVLLAITIPARRKIETDEFLAGSRMILQQFEEGSAAEDPKVAAEEQQSAVLALEDACEKVEAPLKRLEHSLHPWVSFFIMPVFALANAGVSLQGSISQAVIHPVSLGVILGLVLGKQLGITLFSWVAVKTGTAYLPQQVTPGHLYGVSWLCGIGFTMSLFISGLAFQSRELLLSAKLGILIASAVAGLAGFTILWWKGRLITPSRVPAGS